MKKITYLLALAAMISTNSLSAQTVAACPTAPSNKKKEMPAPCPKKEFAWGVGLCGLAVIGVVVGFTASMASQSN